MKLLIGFKSMQKPCTPCQLRYYVLLHYSCGDFCSITIPTEAFTTSHKQTTFYKHCEDNIHYTHTLTHGDIITTKINILLTLLEEKQYK